MTGAAARRDRSAPRPRSPARSCAASRAARKLPEAAAARTDRPRPAVRRRGQGGGSGRPSRLSRRGASPRRERAAGSGAEFLSLSRYLDRRRAAACERPDDRADLRHRHDHRSEGTGEPAPGDGGFERQQGRAAPSAPRVARQGCARDPVPHRQPRRLGGRLGDDLARDRAGARARQAGHRVDGRCRRLGRLLHRRAGRQDRRRAGDADRLDRGRRRQVRASPGCSKSSGSPSRPSQRGANAGMFSAMRGFLARPSGSASTRFSTSIYQRLQGRMSRPGRHLTTEAVEAVAKGRVWTGEDAKANGLVDALGGYEVALGSRARRSSWRRTRPST